MRDRTFRDNSVNKPPSEFTPEFRAAWWNFVRQCCDLHRKRKPLADTQIDDDYPDRSQEKREGEA